MAKIATIFLPVLAIKLSASLSKFLLIALGIFILRVTNHSCHCDGFILLICERAMNLRISCKPDLTVFRCADDVET